MIVRPEVLTLNYIQQNLLIPQCVKCHAWVEVPEQIQRRVSSGNPQGSRLFQVMENGRMPPRPAQPVSTADLELMREYIIQLAR